MHTPGNVPYAQIAAHLKLLAHPDRLKILDALRRETECVCHLEALLDKPQPFVSRHLALLRDSALIVDERRGQNVYYRIANDDVALWLESILGSSGAPLAEIQHHKRLITCACPKCNDGGEAPVFSTEIELLVQPVVDRRGRDGTAA
jgi:ArsR family transcriptional regulator